MSVTSYALCHWNHLVKVTGTVGAPINVIESNGIFFSRSVFIFTYTFWCMGSPPLFSAICQSAK